MSFRKMMKKFCIGLAIISASVLLLFMSVKNQPQYFLENVEALSQNEAALLPCYYLKESTCTVVLRTVDGTEIETSFSDLRRAWDPRPR